MARRPADLMVEAGGCSAVEKKLRNLVPRWTDVSRGRPKAGDWDYLLNISHGSGTVLGTRKTVFLSSILTGDCLLGSLVVHP